MTQEQGYLSVYIFNNKFCRNTKQKFTIYRHFYIETIHRFDNVFMHLFPLIRVIKQIEYVVAKSTTLYTLTNSFNFYVTVLPINPKLIRFWYSCKCPVHPWSEWNLNSFFFLLFLQLGGIAILAVGVAFLLRVGDIEKIFEEWNVQAVPILFIVIGAIIFIVAFFGCCGAIKESHCMTVTYSTFLMIMLLAQIVLAIVVFVYIGDVQEATKKVLNRLWTNRETDSNRQIWDNIQSQVSEIN